MTLKIYSEIIPEEERQFRLMFMGLDGVSFNGIDEFIASIPEDDDTIDMRINSPGGVVSEGWGIIDKLRATGKKITATVEGQASSMASLILLAASERRGYKHATVLIHDAFYQDMYLNKGTAEELEKHAAILREDNQRALDFMVERTGADRDVLEAIMKEDKPMSMERAKELGFIHEILEPASATNIQSPTDMGTKKKIASAFKAFAEAIGLSVKMEAETDPVGYVLTAQDGTEISIEISIDKPEGEDPAVGDKATPDGEHLMPDGTTIVIADGVITEIRDAEPEEAPEADPEDSANQSQEADLDAINEAHAAELAEKDAEIARLQARVTELEASQISDDQRDILAKVDKAGGAAWLEKSIKSSYRPSQRQRQEQTVQHSGDSKTAEALAAARAKKAAKRDRVVRKNDDQ